MMNYCQWNTIHFIFHVSPFAHVSDPYHIRITLVNWSRLGKTITEKTDFHMTWKVLFLHFLFYILWIYLLNVINLIYCAKVLSNWRCQLIRIMIKRGWLQEWIIVPYVFLVTSKLFLPLFCAAVLFWVQSDSVFNRYLRTTCLTWLSLLLIAEVPRRYYQLLVWLRSKLVMLLSFPQLWRVRLMN